MTALTDRQRDVVDSLAVFGGSVRVWARPMDIGGRDSSHHTGTLRSLIAKGIVERKVRAGITRNSYLYRLTMKGWRIRSR